MASTAEHPTEPPSEREEQREEQREEPPDEMSPLVGSNFGKQRRDDTILTNLFFGEKISPSTCLPPQAENALLRRGTGTGTGWIVQIALIILVLLVVVPIFRNKIVLFSGHPLSQIIGIYAVVQSILILQPTHLPEQKQKGQWLHVTFHFLSFAAFVTGVTIIEYNKFHNDLDHFHSVHAYIGVVTAAVLCVQYIVGMTMWAAPCLYGGDANAKKVWKYHRWSGYLVLLLLIASVVSATETEYVVSVLKIRILFVSLACFALAMAILSQVSQKKLGVRRATH